MKQITATVLILALAVACSGRPIGDESYDQGVRDAAEPGACDLIDLTVEANNGDLEAARNELTLAALSAQADVAAPGDPIPPEREFRRYVDGLMEGCGVGSDP